MKPLAIVSATGLATSALAAGIVGLDASRRTNLLSTPRMRFHLVDPAPSKRVFVLLPGAQVEGEYLYPQLLPVFQGYGDANNDVLVADAGRERFNADMLVNTICQNVTDYERVTFVGASMGFMIAWDATTALRQEHPVERTDILSLDGITGSEDLILERPAKIGARIYPGPLGNHLLTKPIWEAGFRPADLSNINPRDKDELARLWACYTTFPLSTYTDQLRYIVHHAPLRPNGARIAMVQSMNDTQVVRLETARANHRQLGEVTTIEEVTSGHLALLDEPDLYEAAVLSALDSLN